MTGMGRSRLAGLRACPLGVGVGVGGGREALYTATVC